MTREELDTGTLHLRWAPEDEFFLVNKRGDSEFGPTGPSVLHIENDRQAREARDLLTRYLDGEEEPRK